MENVELPGQAEVEAQDAVEAQPAVEAQDAVEAQPAVPAQTVPADPGNSPPTEWTQPMTDEEQVETRDELAAGQDDA